MSRNIITEALVVTESDYQNFPKLAEKIDVTVDTLPEAKIEQDTGETGHTTILVTDTDWDGAESLVRGLLELFDELEQMQAINALNKPAYAEAKESEFPGDND